MPRANILYHIPHTLSEHQCAKLEHILRHHQGVMSAAFCCHKPQTLNVEYDRDRTDATRLLATLRDLDSRATIISL